MKFTRSCVIAMASLWLGEVAAGEIIAHPTVHVSPSDVRNVFLGEKQLMGSQRLFPVDNSALQTEFLAKVLQTDERKYAARWIRKTFREGLAAPTVKGSDAEVISFVRSTPGAIGYVTTTGEANATIKVLEKF